MWGLSFWPVLKICDVTKFWIFLCFDWSIAIKVVHVHHEDRPGAVGRVLDGALECGQIGREHETGGVDDKASDTDIQQVVKVGCDSFPYMLGSLIQISQTGKTTGA